MSKAWKYSRECPGGRIFDDVERANLGPEWVDHPDKINDFIETTGYDIKTMDMAKGILDRGEGLSQNTLMEALGMDSKDRALKNRFTDEYRAIIGELGDDICPSGANKYIYGWKPREV